MSGVVVNDLCKSYGDQVVLYNLNLEFEEGLTTCMMGPSGCGKTTFLRLLAGLEKADSGTIDTGKSRISYVFQEDRLSENYTAVSNIRFVVGKSMHTDEIVNILKVFGLEDFTSKPVRDLSGGMKRRVAIARALCVPYDLLILDEPLKGLDEKLKHQVMDLIKKNTDGKTAIYVTHDPMEAEIMGDRIIKWEGL